MYDKERMLCPVDIGKILCSQCVKHNYGKGKLGGRRTSPTRTAVAAVVDPDSKFAMKGSRVPLLSNNVQFLHSSGCNESISHIPHH